MKNKNIHTGIDESQRDIARNNEQDRLQKSFPTGDRTHSNSTTEVMTSKPAPGKSGGNDGDKGQKP